MREASPTPRITKTHDRTYAAFLACGLVWMAFNVLLLLSRGAPTPGMLAYYERTGHAEALDTVAVKADALLGDLAPFVVPAVLILGLLGIIGSHACARHEPLRLLRLVLYGFPFAAALVGLNVFAPGFLLGCSLVFSAVVILVPVIWFVALRRVVLRRGTPELEMSYAVRRTVAWALVVIGGGGVVVWPFAWIAHFRHVQMGGHPSGHPMFTIYIGFLPFAVLLGIGAVLYPYRRWTRGRYAKRPPGVA